MKLPPLTREAHLVLMIIAFLSMLSLGFALMELVKP